MSDIIRTSLSICSLSVIFFLSFWLFNEINANKSKKLLAQYNLIPNIISPKMHQAFLSAFNTEKINSNVALTWWNFIHTTRY